MMNNESSALLRVALAINILAVLSFSALSAGVASAVDSDAARATRLERAADVAMQGIGKDGFIDRNLKSRVMKALRAAEDVCPQLARVRPYPPHTLDALDVALTSDAWARLRLTWKPAGLQGTNSISSKGTGVAGLDELNARFAIKEIETSVSPRLTLTFSSPLDMPAVARLYSALPDVAEAVPGGIAGAGSSITLRTGPAEWNLKYSYGWGDCEAGCIHRYFYEVAYDPVSGRVRMLKEWPSDGSIDAAKEVHASCRFRR